MDDPIEAAFVRVQGRLTAMQTMLAYLMKSSPETLDAAKIAIEAIDDLATLFEGKDDERMQIAAGGMRDFLQVLSDEFDT